ncbi:peptidoglycan-binding protein [Actinosynnema sp. NPDC023587]|uniref:peptidoglycan-binding protein n=1 Tax=Actinosynnema sp. NPDC023587 TaxID=3154695 RepID=UPI0033C8964E
MRRRRRRRAVAGATVATVVVAGAFVWFTQVQQRSDAAQSPQSPKPKTAEVVRTDLVTSEKVDASVTHAGESVLTGRKPGTITWLPQPGTLVERGRPVYATDAVEVPLFLGTVPMYREIGPGVPAGPDVQVVEENLRDLGYQPGTVDEVFSAGTEAAVRRWQRDREVEQTGRVGLGDVVVAPAPQQVLSITATLGGSATGELMRVSGTDRVVAVRLPVDLRGHLAVGMKVEIVLGGGRTATGTVATIDPAVPAQQDKAQDGDQVIPVAVTIDDQAAVDPAGSTAVAIRFETARRAGVLAVPVQALLALREGGYAVEVLEGGQRRLEPVELGIFADGRVEVTGAGVAEGMTVVAAS